MLLSCLGRPPAPSAASQLWGVKMRDSGLENKNKSQTRPKVGSATWGSEHPPDPWKAPESGPPPLSPGEGVRDQAVPLNQHLARLLLSHKMVGLGSSARAETRPTITSMRCCRDIKPQRQVAFELIGPPSADSQPWGGEDARLRSRKQK